MFGFRYFSRRRLLRKPFPEAWEVILTREWPLWPRLKPDVRQKMRDSIKIIIHEKNFEGCAGLSITDEMKTLVAAQASILLTGGVSDHYPNLRSILIYPTKYLARVEEHWPAGIVNEGAQWRFGESWAGGNVVLAWDEVQRGAANHRDGRNLVLHEFAHQLDNEYRITESTEAFLDFGTEPRFEWIREFAGEWMRFIRELQIRRVSFFDDYGAENPAEFFSVVTEAFIEQPREFKKTAPRLFSLLIEFYGFDPLKTINP